MSNLKKIILLITINIVIISCSNFKQNVKHISISPYTLEINQGNDILQENIEQLKIGNSKEEVIKLLGPPLIRDPFHKERWDYQYYLKKKKKKKNKIITIYFKNNKIINIQKSE